MTVQLHATSNAFAHAPVHNNLLWFSCPLQDFHARYYHPSNGRFWFYGDDDPTKRLELLAAYLDEFEARPVDSHVETQRLWTEPRRVTGHYAAGDSEEDSGKVRSGGVGGIFKRRSNLGTGCSSGSWDIPPPSSI